MSHRLETRRQRLIDLSRALGRPETLLDPARQRFDLWSDRLGPGLFAATTRKRATFNGVAGRMQPGLLTGFISRERRLLQDRAARLGPALARLSRDTARDNARRKGELAAFAERLTIAQRTNSTRSRKASPASTARARRSAIPKRSAGAMPSSAPRALSSRQRPPPKLPHFWKSNSRSDPIFRISDGGKAFRRRHRARRVSTWRVVCRAPDGRVLLMHTHVSFHDMKPS